MLNNRLISTTFTLLVILLSIFILDALNILSFLLGLINMVAFLPLSLLLALVFEPIIDLIPIKNRVLRCTLIYFSLFCLFIVFMVIFIPTLTLEFNVLAENFKSFSVTNSRMIQDIEMVDFSKGLEFAFTSTVSIFKSVGDFAFSYIAAYFISLDLSSFGYFVLRHFPWLTKYNNFYRTCYNVIFHYIKGIAIDLGILFIANVTILVLFNFAHPLVFSMLISFLNLIPYVGATLGQVLVIVIDFLNTGQLRFELFIILFVVQQIEANLLQPYIFKKVLNIKPIITLCAIVIFGYIFGFIGYILAPILAVILQLAYQSYNYANQRKKVGTWENMWYNFEEIDDEDK